MSTFSGYKTKAFSEAQKFFVLDPQTGSPSFVQGSDLVKQLTPNSNYVFAERTRTTAQSTDYEIGALIQTAGDTAVADDGAAYFLVVESGAGDFPMDNGNELLFLYDDDLLRADLADNNAAKGSDLIAHTGTSETVTQALDRRTIYVGSVAELEGLSLAEGTSVELTASGISGRGVVKSGTPPSDPKKGIYIPLANGNYWHRDFNDLYIEYFGAVLDDATDNTAAIQAAINLAVTLGINELHAKSGVARFSKLYFTYDSVNNPGFPSAVREGWGLTLKGKGRLYGEPTSQVEIEIAATLGTVFRSTETTGIPFNAVVEDPATTHQGIRFKQLSLVGDTANWMFVGSAIPNSDLFESVSVYNKNNDGSGVKTEDVFVSSWRDVLISCPDYTGVQTGTALIARNRIFAGGGMWNWENINVRGGKYSGQIGYMADPGVPVMLLDSLIINVIQCRNAQHGLQIVGKVRSAFIAGYHTEGCTETGGRIAAEAGSVLMVAPYFDCALCTDASLVLGNSAGVAGANLDERTWSEVELRAFNFMDTNNVCIKVDDGAFGQNLVLATGKLGKVNGAGTLGIDFNSFDGAVRLSNVRYAGLATNFTGLNPDQYVDDGNFIKHASTMLAYDKKEIVVETLAATKFLSILAPEKQIITPTASAGRVVMPATPSGREFFFHNADGSLNLSLRDPSNSTTLYTVPAGESISAISDGSQWIFF